MFCRFACLTGLLLILPFAAAFADAPAANTAPTARVHTGLLSGIHDAATGLDEFKGVPYAAAPVGKLRWRPPQPVHAWRGVRVADHFGPRCMQRAIFGDMVFRSAGMSEDCLYLNVWTPVLGRDQSLPVLVYFHGGGFRGGDGSEPRYDGASLARKGIVTVTVNYRLGVFGFLALPALAAESPQHATGNYGLLDQVAALRWVRRNIAAFGGDPKRVTIGGESAGSMSVSALLASPLSRGLMQGAIGESGAMLGNLAPQPRKDAEQHGVDFRKHVQAQSLAQLRAMPARKLLAATGDKAVARFRPTIDGYFLPRSPVAIYREGKQAHVPLLVGSNSREGYYAFLLHGQDPTPANYQAAVKKRFGQHAAAALTLYPGRDEAQVKASGTALSGDQFIAFATWCWMHRQRTSGASPVYYYFFTKPRPAPRDGSAGPGQGAVHSGEIEYALGNLSGNHVFAWTDADRKVASIMQGYFVNFIKTGDPNGKGLPHWPSASLKKGGLLRQVIGVDTRTIVDHRSARYRFLQQIFHNDGKQ